MGSLSTDNPQTPGLPDADYRVRTLMVVGAALFVLGLTALFLVVPVRLEQPIYDGKHRTLGDVRYGWLFDWLSQDQRVMDPPAGNSQSFCDIRECHTNVLWAGLAGNILVLWIGLAISALALALLGRKVRSRRT